MAVCRNGGVPNNHLGLDRGTTAKRHDALKQYVGLYLLGCGHNHCYDEYHAIANRIPLPQSSQEIALSMGYDGRTGAYWF